MIREDYYSFFKQWIQVLMKIGIIAKTIYCCPWTYASVIEIGEQVFAKR